MRGLFSDTRVSDSWICFVFNSFFFLCIVADLLINFMFVCGFEGDSCLIQ